MKKLLIIAAILASALQVSAQGTVEDYKRAFALGEKFSANKVYYSNVRPSWIGETHNFWYVRHTPSGDEYVLVNADKQTKKPLFDQAKFVKAVKETIGKELDPAKLNLGYLRVSDDLATLTFIMDNHTWEYGIKKSVLKDLGELPEREPQPHWMVVSDEKDFPPVPSPDGKYVAFIRNYNVAVRNVETGEVR